ncbi:MAG: SurA N-terminal domain-containing protein [Geminicoccaceae bacterium]
MLNSIRKQAGSWIVKVLFLVLVASFAIWGIGDVFRSGSHNPAVATVDDTEISSSDLAEAFSNRLDAMQRQFGTAIDRERAIQLGLMQQSLQELIARRLIDLRARDMGLRVDDATLRQAITDNPVFQTAGKFDRSRFEQLLSANGMTEGSYLVALRQDALRSTLAGSLTGPVVAPKILVDAIYRYRNEQRRGRYLEVPDSSITDLPQPSEDELSAYHDEHQEQYRAPEYRKITFVALRPEDLVAGIGVAEERIEEAYQTRIDQFRTPEQRTVEQLLAPDEKTIQEAARQLADGRSLQAIAEAMKDKGVVWDELGTVAKGNLPADLEKAIFGTNQGEVSAPVKSSFGWHLFRVDKVTPESVKPLALVHDQLEHELALADARDQLPSIANRLDDELAAGTPLADAAAAVGLKAETLAAIDIKGQDPSGKRPDALPPWPEFLKTAFQTQLGETSVLEETSSGADFVLRVDEVKESRVKPVDEVRQELVQAWQAEQRKQLARERAESLLAKAKDGTPLEQLASENGLSVKTIEPVKRTDQGNEQGINPAAVRVLFAAEPGKVAKDVVALGDGFAIVAADEVIAADPSKDPDGVKRLKTELEGDMRADLLDQFQAQLRRDYPVEINAAALNRLMGPDGLAPSAPVRMPQLPGGY